MQRVVHTWTAIHRSGSVLSKAEQGPMPASLYTILSIPPSPLSFLEFLLPPLCFSVAATAVAYFTTSTQGHIKIFLNKNQCLTVAGICSQACNPSTVFPHIRPAGIIFFSGTSTAVSRRSKCLRQAVVNLLFGFSSPTPLLT